MQLEWTLRFILQRILLQKTAHLYGFNVSACEPRLPGVEHAQSCVSGSYNLSAAHSFWTQLYNLVIRKCTFPLLLAPRLKNFKWKFTTPTGIEPWTDWTRGRHATIWASGLRELFKDTSPISIWTLGMLEWSLLPGLPSYFLITGGRNGSKFNKKKILHPPHISVNIS